MITGIPDDYPVADLPAWTRQLNQMILDTVHPIGSIIATANNINPGTNIGGTWTPYAAGRVLVGLDLNNASFDTAGMTGGAATVTLTAAQSGLPSHTHTQAAHNHTSAAHTHSINHDHAAVTSSTAGAHSHTASVSMGVNNDVSFGAPREEFFANTNSNLRNRSVAVDVQGNHTHSVNLPNFEGTSGSTTPGATGSATPTINAVAAANATVAHTNLQPYAVVHYWQRTA